MRRELALLPFFTIFSAVKKVLILAYDFPPYVSVGGLRPYNWYKYFKEFDIEPIVVTRQWGNKHGNHLDYIEEGSSKNILVEKSEFGTILRSPYHPNLSNRLLLKHGEKRFKILRKSITAFYELGQFLFPIGPKSEIYATARSFLKENKVDAIIASGDPFILFSYANQLSKEFNLPWIADYRDPWSQNQELVDFRVLRAWHSYFEKRTVKNAHLITTVSSFVAKKNSTVIPNKEVLILPNGYEPELIDELASLPQKSDEFQIAFVGTIYDWHPLEGFLTAVQQFLISNYNAKIRINFYGTNVQNKITELVNSKYPALKNHVTITAKMPNSELLKKLAENNTMLLFNYYSYMGTKIFDYLGIKRKIILCFTDDPEANELKRKFYKIEELESESNQLQAELVEKTNSGIAVKDQFHLIEVLQALYIEFEEKGFIACDSIGVENYSRKIQTQKLAEMIKSL
ncbi:MAG: hypothetical protein V4638_03665 [Bacteroidota bacterium]